jgi:DNA repair protein RecO (recombination protein O)
VPLAKATGLVLRTRPWREHDKLVFLFSKERGKMLATAHGGRRPQSSWGGSLEPLTELELELYEKGDRRTITQCRIFRSHSKLRTDLGLCTVALSLTELVGEFLRDEDPSPRLYQELQQALVALEEGVSQTLVSNAFTLKLLSLVGFWPSLDICALCGKPVNGPLFAFEPRAGGVLCVDCRGLGPPPLSVRGSALREASHLLVASWEELRQEERGNEELGELLRLFIAVHLEKGYSAVQAFRAKMSVAERAYSSPEGSGSGTVKRDSREEEGDV